MRVSGGRRVRDWRHRRGREPISLATCQNPSEEEACFAWRRTQHAKAAVAERSDCRALTGDRHVLDRSHQRQPIGEVDLAVAIVVDTVADFSSARVNGVLGVVAIVTRCCRTGATAMSIAILVDGDLRAI